MNPNTEIEPADTCTSPFAYRGNGKVARLPKSTRDQICEWMRNGLSYPDIIQNLGEPGKNLTPDNLSEWRKRGFQDWLLEQSWLDLTRARQESAAALSTDFDATQINHAALQLGTLQIFDALRSLGGPQRSEGGLTPDLPYRAQLAQPAADIPQTQTVYDAAPTALPLPAGKGRGQGNFSVFHASEAQGQGREQRTASRDSNPKSKTQNQKFSTLDFHLGGDTAAFVRLINALARASRETMLLQKYRDACAQARAALRPLRDPARELTEQERRAIVREVDGILGLKSIG